MNSFISIKTFCNYCVKACFSGSCAWCNLLSHAFSGKISEIINLLIKFWFCSRFNIIHIYLCGWRGWRSSLCNHLNIFYSFLLFRFFPQSLSPLKLRVFCRFIDWQKGAIRVGFSVKIIWINEKFCIIRSQSMLSLGSILI